MTKQIPLTQGKFATVDDEDYDFIMQWKWYFADGYARRNAFSGTSKNKKKTYGMHRQILNTPENFETDHINHNKLDNRRCNLRVATSSQNIQNSRAHKDAKSRYKGVYFNRDMNKWAAQVSHVGQRIYLGLFSTEIESAEAYNKKAKELFGEFSLLNQI